MVLAQIVGSEHRPQLFPCKEHKSLAQFGRLTCATSRIWMSMQCTGILSSYRKFSISYSSQEGVSDGIYIPINVPVQSLNSNNDVICRAYHLNNQPETDVHGHASNTDVPHCRQPSHTYLKVLVKGAEETGVPSEYVKWLRSLRHNGNNVEAMEIKLELSQVKLS